MCQEAAEARRRNVTRLAQQAANLLPAFIDNNGNAIDDDHALVAFREFMTAPSFYTMGQMEHRACLGADIAGDDAGGAAPDEPALDPDRVRRANDHDLEMDEAAEAAVADGDYGHDNARVIEEEDDFWSNF